MTDLEAYKVDNLFLLVGGNPLPNYVAARLLAKDPTTTKIWFFHSKETAPVCDALQRELQADGFQKSNFTALQIDEAQPTNIRDSVHEQAQDLPGVIGLNYTGGTKAMAVHAYRALEHDENLKVQFSYLDARSLTMQIEGYVDDPDSVYVGDLLSLKVDQILSLHSREHSMHREPFWPATAQALLRLHSNKELADQWQAWLATLFFTEPAWPEAELDSALTDEDWKAWVRATFVAHEYKRRTWRKKQDRELVIPEAFQAVWTAIREDTKGVAIETLDDLRKAEAKAFRNLAELGKEMEGEWLETAVMQVLQALREQDSLLIGDLVRDIQAKITVKTSDGTSLSQQIQIDVAFTRGYRLFVVSCTTSDDKGICKSKLL
ncbi:MAG: hypothetical protein EI684_17710, partial [Candidatus Viridilinea halotolerans]